MTNFRSLVRGEMNITESGMGGIRELIKVEMGAMVREEIRPMRDLIAGLYVELQTAISKLKPQVTTEVEPVIVDIESLDPRDRVREEWRVKIAALIFEKLDAEGVEADKKTVGCYYSRYYGAYERLTGYRAKKATVWSYYHTIGRKVFTLIDEGHAQGFYDCILRASTPTKPARGRPKGSRNKPK